MEAKTHEDFSVKAWFFKLSILMVSFVLICLYMWSEKKDLEKRALRPKFIVPATR